MGARVGGLSTRLCNQTRKLPAQFRLAAPAVAMEILYFLVIVGGIIAFGYFVLIALLSEFIPAPRLGERCTRSLAHRLVLKLGATLRQHRQRSDLRGDGSQKIVPHSRFRR